MPIFGQTEFKTHLLRIGREAVEVGHRVYVRDKRGGLFMTLDPRQNRNHAIVLPLGIQRFRDDFAGFTSLVRRGFVFSLTQRGSLKPLVARRHSKYRDPLDGIVTQWVEMIAQAAVKQQANCAFSLELAAMAAKGSNDRVLKRLEEISLEIACLAAGHKLPTDHQDDDPDGEL